VALLFRLDRASSRRSSGWGLASAITSRAHGRYGISSFVYSSRRPFHPKRLWDTVSAPFCVIQTEFEDDEEDSDDEEEDGDGASQASAGGQAEDEQMDDEQAKDDALTKMQAQKAELDLPARAACKKISPVWKGVLRSKGFIWLATRPNVHGEWSQAGVSGGVLSLVQVVAPHTSVRCEVGEGALDCKSRAELMADHVHP